MADSLQLDVAAVLKITKKAEVNISGIAINSHELVNEQQHKYLCDKIVSTATSTSTSSSAIDTTPTKNTNTNSSPNCNPNTSNNRQIEPSAAKKTMQHVGLVSTTNNFHEHNFQSQQSAKNLTFQKPQAMESQDEDLRKKRCTDRYDSSESSDR